MAGFYKKENLIQSLLKFSIPIMLSYFVSELYGTIDTLMVGHFVGDMATASVSVVYPLQKILIALGVMTSVGTATALSRAVGERDKRSTEKILAVGLRFEILLIAGISLFVFLFRNSLLSLAGATSIILPDASRDLTNILIGMVFLTTTGFMGTVLLSYGESSVALFSNIIGALVNLALDYLLVSKFKMGVNGAGVATLCSQVVAFSYAVWKFRKVLKKQGLDLNSKMSWKILIAIVAVGVSAFLVESVDGWVGTIFNGFISKIAGERGVLMLGVSQRIYMYIFLANFAVGAAMQPIASYAFGAGDGELLIKSVKSANKLAFVVVMVSWAFCMIFARSMVSFFTNDTEIISELTTAFRIMISLVPISSSYYILTFYYQASKNVTLSLVLSVFRHFGAMLPAALILTKVFNRGIMGIWISYPIADLIVGLLSFVLFRREKRILCKASLSFQGI